MKAPVVLFLLAFSAAAEVRTLTLRDALDIALKQNPDVILARLDQQRARAQVTIATDAFVPKLFAGSGAAYTNGFPMSIDGNAPALIQSKTQMAIFDRPQSYRAAQANEAVRGTEIDIRMRQDEVAYRVASLFFDTDQAARSLAAVERQLQSLIRVRDLIGVRVSEGRELAIEANKANLKVLQAQHRQEELADAIADAETSLAQVLGFDPGDRVQPAQDERRLNDQLDSEENAIQQALDNNREIRRLESNLQAKNLEVKSYKAERLPKASLIAQYSLLSRFNNYDKFFPRFQRNNFEFGVSFEVPILTGRSGSAGVVQAQVDIDKIRTEIGRTRSRITADLQHAYREIRRAESAQKLARTDLDLARDQLTLDLTRYDEGQVTMAQVEAARAAEQEKWIAYYDAQHAVEVARLNVLRQTGTLLASLSQ
ncbi:MAG: TolC family protein [Bryobacterales bacterium]|jgi:outer membrane protein|nr:TolC family protein [Bryobacterales bacterium]